PHQQALQKTAHDHTSIWVRKLLHNGRQPQKKSASNAMRERIWDMGARPAIPAKRRDGPVACPKWTYRCRHLVENLWARLKEWRAVATRYEKTATSFLAVIHIAAAADWIKP
ncbi:transposase, partial [Acetobacter indonesiensis]|uniref:transposase n=1 Tax=Acetobacter indonesiensis TaxID=104101 RepID=UPI0020A5142E